MPQTVYIGRIVPTKKFEQLSIYHRKPLAQIFRVNILNRKFFGILMIGRLFDHDGQKCLAICTNQCHINLSLNFTSSELLMDGRNFFQLLTYYN